MAISFFFHDTSIPLTERRRLKLYIVSLFELHSKRLDSLSYVFCNDKFLLDINRKFLNHDFYTDIITFDMSESKSLLKGEIYISVDRVQENARHLEVSVKEELHRVIFHGALHLCGFKDKSRADKVKMKLEEDRNLLKYLS